MKLFKFFLTITLMSFAGQAYGMSYIKGAFLCLLASNGHVQSNLLTSAIVVTPHAAQNRIATNAQDTAPIFLPNQDTLEKCVTLKQNEAFASSWYQEIIPQVSEFFALERLSKKKVAIASRNLVLSALAREDLLKSPEGKSASDNSKHALQRIAHVTNAVIACQTTRESYRKQKQLWKKLNRRDWIHD